VPTIDATSTSDPDPKRRRLATLSVVLGGLITAAAIYNVAQFWWYARRFEVPFRYFLYAAWLLPAGVLLLVASARVRNGRPSAWILILLALLWVAAILLFGPRGYVYFLQSVSQ
jgi:hypothetical protein